MLKLAQDKFAKTLNELPFSGEAVHRLKLADAQDQIGRGFVIHSTAGMTVKFGEILKRHFEREKDDQRARFLEAAKIAAREPAEVWENNFRHYYVARLRRLDSGELGFVVVAAQIGDADDDVITFFTKDARELKKFRTGKLIHQKGRAGGSSAGAVAAFTATYRLQHHHIECRRRVR